MAVASAASFTEPNISADSIHTDSGATGTARKSAFARSELAQKETFAGSFAVPELCINSLQTERART
ncbi:hypothetical protein LIER_13235 [Lithospermum erythrorhizon]|uniref:Uncharacterized protein n=1 Tax=Lithospermum erythrorhizon TaxID=34254 RepID=A0AAV3PXZ3_LITER